MAHTPEGRSPPPPPPPPVTPHLAALAVVGLFLPLVWFAGLQTKIWSVCAKLWSWKCACTSGVEEFVPRSVQVEAILLRRQHRQIQQRCDLLEKAAEQRQQELEALTLEVRSACACNVE